MVHLYTPHYRADRLVAVGRLVPLALSITVAALSFPVSGATA